MKIIIFGATGMVGQGVLRECLLDPAVHQVLLVGRQASSAEHGKIKQIVLPDLLAIDSVAGQLTGYDACFFCLGVSSVGMSESDYHAVTYDLTLAVATTLARLNPNLTFVYVSGAGTDGSEQGRSMWARVKGKTENALLRLPFKAYMLRPGAIQPLHGVQSKTRWYRLFYLLSAPLLTLLVRWLPKQVTTTEQMGRAMLALVRRGAPKRVLETVDINTL